MAWHIAPSPAPVMPRIKTYSGNGGFVYQYRFTSHDAAPDGDRYCFLTSQDRHPAFDVVVFLPRAAIAAWEADKNRTLTPTERYALAKLALFGAFDEAEKPEAFPNPIEVSAEQVRTISELLDL